MTLADERCASYRADDAPLSMTEASELARNVPQWTLSEQKIEREFKFKDFRHAIAFVSQVAVAAEDQKHHPDILISYNRVRLTLSTHKVGGLTRNDFILAAQIDPLAENVTASATRQ